MHACVPQKIPRTEMCPLCFGPASECPPFLVMNSSLQPRIVCSTYAPTANADAPERGVKFAAASLAKHSSYAPSTNRPIVCSACNPNLAATAHQLPSYVANKKNKARIRPAVWSYNMKAHWRRLQSAPAAWLAASAAHQASKLRTPALAGRATQIDHR